MEEIEENGEPNCGWRNCGTIPDCSFCGRCGRHCPCGEVDDKELNSR